MCGFRFRKFSIATRRACLDQDRSQASAACHFHIHRGVADHPGAGGIEIEIATGGFEQSGARFPAFAGNFQIRPLAREATVRMMRAVVDGIEESSLFAEFPFQLAVDGGEIGFCRFAARDDGLVGEDHQAESRVAKFSKSRADTRQNFEIFRRSEKSAFLIERAIAVEENRRREAGGRGDRDFARLPVRFHLEKAFRCSHVLGIFRCAVGEDTGLAVEQTLHDVLDEVRFARGTNPRGERVAPDDVECGVYEIRKELPFRMRVGMNGVNPAGGIRLDEIRVMRMVVRVDHGGEIGIAPQVGATNFQKVHGAHDVAVENKKVIRQKRERADDGASIAKGFGFHLGADGEPELAAIADK